MGTEEKDLVKGGGGGGEEDDDDDDDGPPPGFHCIATQIEENLVKEEKDAEINENEDDEDEDVDGPPPGWSSIPPATFQPVHPSDVEMSDKQKEDENEEGPPPGWHSVPLASQSSEAVLADTQTGNHEDRTKYIDEGSQPGQKSVPPLKLLPPTPPRPLPAVSSPSDHQVGQVKCGGCAVLLMYPYGAPSVRCCSCRSVTEIGAHNRRPPLSVQQARRPLSVNRVH
ncbi:uncharacterized protein [Coffea arabica]|uniref:Uncharacterized protein isoform X2 n=1 Tax=Coffea arabica TaxID=13443 RepID=A0A6P6VS06_COFAR|nr:protein LOL2-like isoform X2 [Coffea arabica]